VLNRVWPWLAGVNGAYALWWFARAGSRVPLWYDEVFTVRLSAIPDLRGLWRALAGGFDFNPPGIYVATKLARLAPVADPLDARLPALLGFLLLTISLYVFLRRRVGGAIAAAAVALLPLSNFVERYAIEARPYMLLLGISGCALLCWQSLGEAVGRRRVVLACALALSVALALSLHVWAVLLPAALLAGEAACALRTGHPRWIVLAALAAAAPALAMYPMLLHATQTVSFANVVYAPTVGTLASAALTTLPRLRALALVAFAAGVLRWVSRRRAIDPATSDARGLKPEERVALLVCALSPLVPYVYAVAADGAFMTRYALYAVIGVTGLVADVLFVFVCAPAHAAAMTSAGLALVASASLWGYLPARAWVSPTEEIPSLRVLRSATPTVTAPIVLVNPLDVLAIDQRAADSELSRLTFVADPAAARRYTGADLVDIAYLRGAQALHMRIRRTSYVDLTRTAGPLYLLGEWQPLAWLPARLADDGWAMTRIGGTDAAPLFEARRAR
jgi:hypothetical protein